MSCLQNNIYYITNKFWIFCTQRDTTKAQKIEGTIVSPIALFIYSSILYKTKRQSQLLSTLCLKIVVLDYNSLCFTFYIILSLLNPVSKFIIN